MGSDTENYIQNKTTLYFYIKMYYDFIIYCLFYQENETKFISILANDIDSYTFN